MTILEMIAEWRKGCGTTQKARNGRLVVEHPKDCPVGTVALIEAIERKAIADNGGAQ